jgi:hypothetical protein
MNFYSENEGIMLPETWYPRATLHGVTVQKKIRIMKPRSTATYDYALNRL